MSISKYWATLVSQAAITLRAPSQQVEAMVAKAHPDIAMIYRASGETPARIQFCNGKIAAKVANPNLPAKRKQFQADVSAEMASSHCSYDVAFNRVSRKGTMFANSEDMKTVQAVANGSGGVPPLPPELATVFRVPSDLMPDAWRQIWEANGSTATPINYGKMFYAACEIMQQQTGKDLDAAIEPAKARFPDLWAATVELAKLSF